MFGKLFGRGSTSGGALSLDEFVGDGAGRAASPLDLRPGHGDWQAALARLGSGAAPKTAAELALPAFSLVRGGDMFESTRKPQPTPAGLLERYRKDRLQVERTGVERELVDLALQGCLRVLAGNPAIAKRMLIARPIALVVVPEGDDYRRYGFPRNTNPRAAGIFWNAPDEPIARLGLRAERIRPKPWLMVHEMAHAVHFLAFTTREREDVDRMLLPVYGTKRWVEEAFAIYAERAFGARYDDDDLRAPGWYGKTRRDWNAQHVFSLFVAELLRPSLVPPVDRPGSGQR